MNGPSLGQIAMNGQHAELDWTDGTVPVSTRFDDPYFSLQGGLAETRHVFLAGNGLPGRFRDGFRIAELGFGTGLNFLATIAGWIAAGGPGALHYTSFEAFPMAPADRARALAAFPELAPLAPLLGAALAGATPHGVRLTVIPGDARDSLPLWPGSVDAWFLDGFSPAKNPELWEAPLLQTVAARLVSGGTLATYTAAGHVRRALDAAGLEVERAQGYGRKRHMTKARKP
jgi:tRNA U34 5-methylaminomethyl-2-thiouridine-forming methyltransferase MnmC